VSRFSSCPPGCSRPKQAQTRPNIEIEIEEKADAI
jgi:hypothetical protein